MNPIIGKCLVACLWFCAGTVIAGEPVGQAFSDLLNQIDEHNASSCQLMFAEYTCSAVLINNTQLQGRPLVLTAEHCIEIEADLDSVVVIFGKRKLLKDQAFNGLEWRSDEGLTLLSSSRALDFALLELKSEIPVHVAPVFLGWNRKISQPSLISTIHSPDFDAAQYAISTAAPSFATFGGIYNPVELGFWKVDQWVGGITSPGSSGAPLLDADFKLIGGLSGSTDWENHKSDYFFRFDMVYDHFSDPTKQLKAWIDPDHLGSIGPYQPVHKIRNYRFNSSVTGSATLANGATITEVFSLGESAKINGVYVSVGDVSAVSGSTVAIALTQNGSEIYAEETSAAELSGYAENYIQFVSPPVVGDKISISISFKSAASSAQITIPRSDSSEQTSYFLALNSSKP